MPQVGGSLWANLVALWSPQLARITAMTWLTWLSITFSYYAFFIWIPSLLVVRHPLTQDPAFQKFRRMITRKRAV